MFYRRSKVLQLGITVLCGFFLLVAALLIIRSNAPVAHASPADLRSSQGPVRQIPSSLVDTGEITAAHVISPPEGYPKLSLSTKTVSPNLASTEGVTLYYTINIRNTGAWTATAVTLTDVITKGTYNGDAQASDGSIISGTNIVTWTGEVGFDSSVVLSFSVKLPQGLSGIVSNTAVIRAPDVPEAVLVTAETVVTDNPILVLEKSSTPAKPGPNKPLTYTITVANQGQPPVGDLFITVTDQVPLSTALRSVPGGFTSSISDVVTWTRQINLGTGESTEFTFSVDVDDVPAGTVITNEDYQVDSSQTGVTYGDVYTLTVVDPEFRLFKEIWPDPPGSNREMTYTLTLLNEGSLATGLVITDRVPAGVEGAVLPGEVVSWTLPSLDTGQIAQFTFTVAITDVAEVAIVNDDYGVCSEEGICQVGTPLTSVVRGPEFEVVAIMDPLAKKSGGGNDPEYLVTPTLIIRNIGHGDAKDAMIYMYYGNISVDDAALINDPLIGTSPPYTYFKCGPRCDRYTWVGDLGHGDVITFSFSEGQSTQGGEEGSTYTATAVVTDSLSNMTTEPVSDTAVGKITHLADLVPVKSALPVIGPGQLLTYTIEVVNYAYTTDGLPWLTDTLPMSTTFVSASDGGVTQTVSNTTVVSWTMERMNSGSVMTRSFTVRVNNDVVSGTQIINNDYIAYWYQQEEDEVFSNTGKAVTTTVQEVGLIDSYKEVTPTVVYSDGVLTYYVHIVNSSGLSLTGVTVEDLLPWQDSTYAEFNFNHRDAEASGGTIFEQDSTSIHWIGDVDAFSSEVITFSVVVDPGYQGPLTNTAIISHPDLLSEIRRYAGAFVADMPDLQISKEAPYSVEIGAEVPYVIHVANLGQPATALICCSNCETRQPSWVQWPELWTRGAISLTISCFVVSTSTRNISTARTPT